MFYNKKGLLAEIKNTEKKISEKIIVLEDLLDSVKQKPLFAEPDLQQSFDGRWQQTIAAIGPLTVG